MARNCPYRQQAMVNVSKMLFVCQCGMEGRIDHFYSDGGVKTLKCEEAVTAVIELDNGKWTHILLSDFENNRTH